MTVDLLNNMLIPIVVVACLILGYVIKKWLPADNKYIPTILAVVGAILGCIAMHSITLEIIVGGALSGLASTGLYEMFRQYVEHKEEGEQ
jgi:hypothetical protein